MDTVSDQAAVQESQKSSLQISFYIFRALAFADRNRSIASLVGVVLLVTLCDILFDAVLFEPYKGVIAFFSGSFPEGFEGVDMGFSAEVWQALLGMILGTLILVISIASQSIPKLIDLYMKDLPSLIYVWFLIVSGMHAILVNLTRILIWFVLPAECLTLIFFLSSQLFLPFPIFSTFCGIPNLAT